MIILFIYLWFQRPTVRQPFSSPLRCYRAIVMSLAMCSSSRLSSAIWATAMTAVPATSLLRTPGLYMFTTTMCSNYQKSVYAHLMAANTTLAATYKYNGDRDNTCTSISGVAKLSKGEKAWVQGAGSGSYSGSLYTGDIHRWPSFSGMLVHV